MSSQSTWIFWISKMLLKKKPKSIKIVRLIMNIPGTVFVCC